jgi:plasmid stabilization system protein ParE
MHEIVFHTQAAEEMRAAAAYYEAQEPGLGDAFLDDIEQALQSIQQFPQLWSVYDGEYRRYLLKRFPYGLIYRIDEARILIVAVAHLHLKPGYWKDRA